MCTANPHGDILEAAKPILKEKYNIDLDIQISDERLDEELQKMADAYKMEVEKLKEYMGENEKNQMRQDLAVQAAVDLLVAEAKLV